MTSPSGQKRVDLDEGSAAFHKLSTRRFVILVCTVAAMVTAWQRTGGDPLFTAYVAVATPAALAWWLGR